MSITLSEATSHYISTWLGAKPRRCEDIKNPDHMENSITTIVNFDIVHTFSFYALPGFYPMLALFLLRVQIQDDNNLIQKQHHIAYQRDSMPCFRAVKIQRTQIIWKALPQLSQNSDILHTFSVYAVPGFCQSLASCPLDFWFKMKTIKSNMPIHIYATRCQASETKKHDHMGKHC